MRSPLQPALLVLLSVLGSSPCASAEPALPPDFEKSSIALRTALHFDPAADSPLKKLAQLYVSAGKRAELLSLYAAHLSQYPKDENARVVLARLYIELNDDRSATFLGDSIAAHPQNALLAWTHHLFLAAKFDPRALDELDRAISIEKSDTRRAPWLADLLKLAAAQQREDLVVARFKSLLKEQTLTTGQRLRWARQCLTHSLPKAADELVTDADFTALQGDLSVEAVLVVAETNAANGRRAAAARRLDELLGKLAPDYWRRREALLLRLQFAGDAGERDRLIETARQRFAASPASEAEAVSLADLLAAAHRKDEAITVLKDSAAKLPEARLVESRLLDLFDSTNRDQDAIAFLAARVKAQPAREDLALQHARLLLSTGRTDDGTAALDGVLKNQQPGQRATVFVETARWLRARNLLAEAATVLEKLITAQPQRWDARKELGEIYAVLKRNNDLDALFAVEIADDVAPEVRMETVQFLIAQKQWPPARAALEPWLKTRPSDLEGRLLLAKICATTGDVARASALITEGRTMCDTDARYAAWLHSAFDLASDEERALAFVEEERARIWPAAGNAWDAPRLARLLALADVAANAKLDLETEKLVRTALAEDALKDEQRRELQLRLLDVIERQTGREKEIESQLIALTKTPAANTDDLKLRLALLYQNAERRDLAAATLEKTDISGCQDVKLLERAAAACTLETGSSAQMAEMLQRIVQLQPEEPSGWVQWTFALAAIGDEPALRLALRQMLSLSSKWKLNAETTELIRRHLAGSCWREAGRILCREPLDATAKQRALVILDEAERLELSRERKLWAAWARARADASCAGDFSDAIAKLPSGTKWLPFPDGLMLSATHAAGMLRADEDKAAPPPPATGSPILAPFNLAWGYQAAPGTRIQRFAFTPDGSRVLIADDLAHLAAIDRLSGKLCWTTAKMAARPAAAMFAPNVRAERVLLPLEFVSDSDRVFITSNGRLDCRGLTDGTLRWSREIDDATGQEMLATGGGLLLCWRPATATLDAFRPASGKLAWTRTLDDLAKTPAGFATYTQGAIATGLSVEAGHVLVYASGTAILRLEDGAVLWQTSTEEAPPFPLDLRTADDEVTVAGPAPAIVAWTGALTPAPLMVNGYTSPISTAFSRRAFAHPLAVNLTGYSGTYGNTRGPAFLNWGSESLRVLHGGAVWSLSSGSPAARVSVSGLPLISDDKSDLAVFGRLLGFAGGQPVTASADVIARGAVKLWQSRSYSTRASDQLFPASTLHGRTLLVASAEGLMARDAISGEVLFRCDLPPAALSWARDPWQPLQNSRSVRWSSRGVMLYDGMNTTLGLDWRSAARDGDWIVPLGLDKLACLRGAGANETASVKDSK